MIRACLGALLLCVATGASAQEQASSQGPPPAQEPPPSPKPPKVDTRTQYPAFLKNSYFGLNVGSIGYLFGSQQLEPGFKAQSIDVPRLAVRVDLFGHRFNDHLSAQVTYMRPARFVAYQDINGRGESRQVWAAYGGLTLVLDTQLYNKWWMYGEGGVGVTSRSGFTIDGTTALREAHFAAGLLGAGLAYHATPNLDLMFGATYSPGRKGFLQPSTRLFTTGLRYHLAPMSDADVEDNRSGGWAFPENLVRVGFTTNGMGYSLNDFFSKKVPIFWGGNVETGSGFTLDYERNVFHTKKWFAFDLGASASYLTTNVEGTIFRTFSLYPLLRFFLARTSTADVYLAYSVAGPTFISRTVLDGLETGENFTFQDSFGVGMFFGKARRLNAEIGIKHFSNGNIFTHNASIKVPVTFTFGLAF